MNEKTAEMADGAGSDGAEPKIAPIVERLLAIEARASEIVRTAEEAANKALIKASHEIRSRETVEISRRLSELAASSAAEIDALEAASRAELERYRAELERKGVNRERFFAIARDFFALKAELP